MRNPIPAKDDALGTRELLLTLNKRLAFAAIAGGVSAAVMAGAVMALMPLKEQVPYIIEVNKDGSAQVPAQTAAVRYTPAFESKAYFLRRWITDAFTINQYTTTQQLDPRARVMLRGSNAIGAYTDWLKADRKFEMIAEDPTLVRDVDVLSITPIAGTDGGVVADVNLTTRKGGTAVSERKLVTIYFDIFPIADRKDVEVNPLGLFITDFKVGVGNAQK